MVALSEDNDITFMNVCGGIKLQLLGTATIISIKITGNDNETLSGDAVVTAYHDSAAPTIEMLTQASSSVVLNCGEGVQLNEASPTNFILSLPPTLFTKGFVVTILDSMGGVYELNSGKQNEVRRSSLLVMPPIDIRETVVSTRMLKLVSIDYNSYQIEVTVPETVSPDGNIIRYAYGCEAIVNQNLKTGWDYDSILQWNGGDRNTTDISRVLTIQETCDVDGSYIIEPIAPGEPTVFIAGEYTRDGQLIGEPEIIKFKTKEPSVLNADFDVTIEDVTSTDATFCVMPDDDIYLYCMIVLDDETYNNILSNIVSESDLQWFVSSYYAMYSFGTYLQIGGCTFNLSNFFVSAPPADTKYHILITGLGNQEGTSQCFKHVEFKTEAKQRSQGPSITVTHLPEKSSDNRCVFNIKCTSVDNKDAGAVVQGYFAYANICDWESALNQGLSYEEILKHSQYFSSFELHMINSDCGYDLSFDLSNGYETSTESTRVAFLFYNDEFTPSDVIITDVEGHLTLPSPPPLIQ